MADATKYTKKLAERRILVLGGSSGIGFAVAEASVEQGAHVTISSSNAAHLETAKASLLASYPSASSRIHSHVCDVGHAATLESNIVALLQATGTIDHIVVTAAEPLNIRALKDVTVDSLQQAGLIRFFAPLMIAKHAVEWLSPGPRASITYTTGSVSERPVKGWSVATGFSTGLQGMTRSLALDLAPLRVNLVSPGMVQTPLWNFLPEDQREEMKQSMKKQTTTGVMGKPEDVAEAYIYLMRDENITGTMISTNGGQLLL